MFDELVEKVLGFFLGICIGGYILLWILNFINTPQRESTEHKIDSLKTVIHKWEKKFNDSLEIAKLMYLDRLSKTAKGRQVLVVEKIK